jgi:hypothetical protein
MTRPFPVGAHNVVSLMNTSSLLCTPMLTTPRASMIEGVISLPKQHGKETKRLPCSIARKATYEVLQGLPARIQTLLSSIALTYGGQGMHKPSRGVTCETKRGSDLILHIAQKGTVARYLIDRSIFFCFLMIQACFVWLWRICQAGLREGRSAMGTGLIRARACDSSQSSI